MDGSDFNLITPVNSLQSIGGMTHVERRQERKQHKKGQGQQAEDAQPQDAVEERIDPDQLLEDFVADEDDPHSIDYKA